VKAREIYLLGYIEYSVELTSHLAGIVWSNISGHIDPEMQVRVESGQQMVITH